VKFLTGFGQRPQHVLGTIGLTSFFLGGLWLIYMALRWILSRVLMGAGLIEDPNVTAGLVNLWNVWAYDSKVLYHLQNRPAVIYATGLLLMGGQLMSIGFLGELFIAYHGHNVKTYSISERAGPEEDQDAVPPAPAEDPNPDRP